MVCFINKYQLKRCRVKFRNSIAGNNALQARDRYVCSTTGVYRAHLNVNGFRRVCIATVPSSLLH